MAAMINPLLESVPDPEKDPKSDLIQTTLFHRRVEFRLARKPFSGFAEGGTNGFKLVTLNPNSNPCSKSEPHIPWSGSGKTSEHSLERNANGLDPELSFTITFRRIGAGLQNLGNTCFLNSVLQCLTYTEPLAAYLQSGRHKISCRMAGFCALCAIQKHVSRALESTGRILAPKDLVSNLRCISRSFRNARQEDAHEYMVNLLESMHKCCLPSGVPSESPGAYEKSLVHKIFGGRLRSQVKCMQCSFCSNKFDPFLDLSLEIVKADSLYKALAHFTAREQLDGGERQYQCQQCKQKVKALKQLTIDKAPEVLAIHLKRFGSHVPGQKIDKKIQFGSTLDLKPFVTGLYDGDLKYTLYGVLVHAGWSTHSGHYYCFVRTSSGMWYSLDDNQVFQVGERRVLEQKAYMLFYVRDKTFSTSKKAVDVVGKESMVINKSGRKDYSSYNQALKENIPNGTVEKKLNGSFSAEAAAKQALNPLMLNEIQMKVDSLQDGNAPAAPKCSSPKKDHQAENSLKVPSEVGSVNGFPISNLNGEGCSVQTVASFKGFDGSVSPVNSTNECSSTCNGLMVPVIVQHDCHGLHSSTGKNECASVVLPTTDNMKEGDVKCLSNAIDKTSNSNDLHACLRDASILEENNTEKVGSFSRSSGVADSSVKKSDGVKDGVCLSRSPKGLRHKKALDDRLHTVKRKPLKRLVTIKKLSKNIIFGVAFGRRKKKHRKSEHYSSTKLDGNHIESNKGPCTFEKSKVQSICCSGYSPRRTECGSDEKDKVLGTRNLAESVNLWNGGTDVAFRDRVDQNGKSFAPGTELHMSSSDIPCEKPKSGGKSEHCKGGLVENGLMSMLTRGLEETTVARWDGVEHSAGFVESRSGENLRIGYIGDEWDEEYDSGKRKKIRSSKIIFDGSNPFQEIAMRKAKTKRAKLDQYTSANQPFRI